MENDDVKARIDRMAEIKRQQEALKTEWTELEAFFLKSGSETLANTKRKSISYHGSMGKLTATMTQKPEITWPVGLKMIFKENYSKAVTEKTDYKLSAEAGRILIGISSGGYERSTVSEVIAQIPVSDDVKKLLSKKLRGVNYDTDKNNLMVIGGLNENDAEHYAYFIYEASVWEAFQRLMAVNQIADEKAKEEMLKLICNMVVVTETPKVALELFEQ